MPNYQCVNFGTCPKADGTTVIEIKPGEEFKCPCDNLRCREDLMEIKPRGSARRKIMIGAPILLVVCFVAWLISHYAGSTGDAQPEASPKAATVEGLLIDVFPWLK